MKSCPSVSPNKPNRIATQVAVIALGTIFCAGCAEMQKMRTEALEAKYGHLTADSYGPLSVNFPKNRTTISRICNPPTADELTEKLADGIASGILDSLGVDNSLLQHNWQTRDPELYNLNLNRFFEFDAGDGFPSVRVMSHTDRSLYFWVMPISHKYGEEEQRFRETTAAADDYCKQNNGIAVYQGAAASCGDPIALPMTNGKVYRQPFLIIGYQCIIPTPSAKSGEKKKKHQA